MSKKKRLGRESVRSVRWVTEYLWRSLWWKRLEKEVYFKTKSEKEKEWLMVKMIVMTMWIQRVLGGGKVTDQDVGEAHGTNEGVYSKDGVLHVEKNGS